MNIFAKTSLALVAIAIPSLAQAETLRFYNPAADKNEPSIAEVAINPNPANAAAAAADAARYQVIDSGLVATSGADAAQIRLVYDPVADSGESNWKKVVIVGNAANAEAATADAAASARLQSQVASGEVRTKLMYNPAATDNEPSIVAVPAGS